MSGGGLAERTLGRSGLAVSELGLGAAPLGNLYSPMSDTAARDTLQAALAAGVTYVDTAPYYGFGLSERRVGDGVRERPDVVVSTKVGRLLRPARQRVGAGERHGFHSAMPFDPVFDYGHDAILRSYEDSLQRLGLARIDILYVHDIGSHTHGADDGRHFDALIRGGGLRALQDLRSSGAVRAIGVGVNEIDACIRVMDHCDLDAVLLAGRYTLLEQTSLDILFPRCVSSGTSVVVGGPYNSGILATGVLQGGPAPYDYAAASPGVIERVAKIERVCRSFDVPLAAAAIQFPLAHPVVASVIPGLDRAERIGQTVGLRHWEISGDLWIELRKQGLLHPAAPTPGA